MSQERMQKKLRILLYNPISGHGHLDSWNALFVELLLQRGYEVAALTPDEAALRKILLQKGINDHPGLKILAWECVPPSVWALREWRYVWGGYGDVSRDMPFLQIIRKVSLRILFRTEHGVRQQVLRAWRTFRSVFEKNTGSWLDPSDMVRRIRETRNRQSFSIDFLFVMYMDMFYPHSRGWGHFDNEICLPWGGIRFTPQTLNEKIRKEDYYALRSLKGMCFLEEEACSLYRSAMPEKIFQFLPDITNTALPDEKPDIVRKMQEVARGRQIVFLGGSLDHRKNIEGFCTLAMRADPEKFLFVMVGRLYDGSFSEADRMALEFFRNNMHGNTFLYPDYIEDERDFNALIATSDILFAVYKDFHGSSNMLTKSASFGKPILVSDGYLMGNRVRAYGTGMAVPEEDLGMEKTMEALEYLYTNPVPAECYKLYLRDFCLEAMGDALETFIQKGLSGE